MSLLMDWERNFHHFECDGLIAQIEGILLTMFVLLHLIFRST